MGSTIGIHRCCYFSLSRTNTFLPSFHASLSKKNVIVFKFNPFKKKIGLIFPNKIRFVKRRQNREHMKSNKKITFIFLNKFHLKGNYILFTFVPNKIKKKSKFNASVEPKERHLPAKKRATVNKMKKFI